MTNPVPVLFTKSIATQSAYQALAELIEGLPDVVVEEKKTCVHLSTSGAAFLGVHPRKQGLRLTLPLKRRLPEDQIVKCEQASTNRFYNEVDFIVGQATSELSEWIREAYDLKRE